MYCRSYKWLISFKKSYAFLNSISISFFFVTKTPIWFIRRTSCILINTQVLYWAMEVCTHLKQQVGSSRCEWQVRKEWLYALTFSPYYPFLLLSIRNSHSIHIRSIRGMLIKVIPYCIQLLYYDFFASIVYGLLTNKFLSSELLTLCYIFSFKHTDVVNYFVPRKVFVYVV